MRNLSSGAAVFLCALMLTTGGATAADGPGAAGRPPAWGTKKTTAWSTPGAKVVKKKAVQDVWACPMMCVKLNKPGKCPKCKMDLEKLKPVKKPAAGAMKKTYACTMCHITSDKPGKCSHCGMELVEQKEPERKM